MIFRPLEIVGYIGWLLLNRVLQHVNRLPAGVDSPDFGEVVRALIAHQHGRHGLDADAVGARLGDLHSRPPAVL